MGAGRASVVWRLEGGWRDREAESEGSMPSSCVTSVQPSDSAELLKLCASLSVGECTDALLAELLPLSG